MSSPTEATVNGSFLIGVAAATPVTTTSPSVVKSVPKVTSTIERFPTLISCVSNPINLKIRTTAPLSGTMME